MNLKIDKIPNENEIKKLYKVFPKEATVLEISKIFGISIDEVYGLLEIFKYFGYSFEVKEINDEIIISKEKKNNYYSNKKIKPSIDECTKFTIGVVSDTHLCSKEQQLHMLNTAYRFFYENEIDTVYHCGDVVDGDYAERRKSQLYSRFMHGVKEQSDYVIDMYPYVEGIKTHFIQGSHDETHKINGGAILGEIIQKNRKDMIYEGQDVADVFNHKVKIRLRHPGGGVSKYRSRSIQNTIDNMPSKMKAKLLLEGHYHKSYYLNYRNVHGVLVPCLCYQSQFMQKKDISNIMGYYVIDIYCDEKGNIQYITPKEKLFTEDEVKKNDFIKTKRLVIKH